LNLPKGTVALVTRNQTQDSTEVRCTIDGQGHENWLLPASMIDVRENFHTCSLFVYSELIHLQALPEPTSVTMPRYHFHRPRPHQEKILPRLQVILKMKLLILHPSQYNNTHVCVFYIDNGYIIPHRLMTRIPSIRGGVVHLSCRPRMMPLTQQLLPW
jgi:hypothetical protein